jgi:hypothetical protein
LSSPPPCIETSVTSRLSLERCASSVRVVANRVRALRHLDPDDDYHYTTVLDASRLPVDRLVRILLAADGITDRAPPPGESLNW